MSITAVHKLNSGEAEGTAFNRPLLDMTQEIAAALAGGVQELSRERSVALEEMCRDISRRTAGMARMLVASRPRL